MIGVVRIKGAPPGVCRYALQINRERLVEFDHLYSDGLAACLRRAAEAFEENQKKIVADIGRRWNEIERMRREVSE